MAHKHVALTCASFTIGGFYRSANYHEGACKSLFQPSICTMCRQTTLIVNKHTDWENEAKYKTIVLKRDVDEVLYVSLIGSSNDNDRSFDRLRPSAH